MLNLCTKKQLYYILFTFPFNIGILYNLIINDYDLWYIEMLFVFYCVIIAYCFTVYTC